MTWELLGVNGKRDSRATESYHLGTLIFQLKLGELGAKEPPQALKLYFISIRMTWDLVECEPGEPGDRDFIVQW